MNTIQNFLLKHARASLGLGVVLLLVAGAYGFGLFHSLGDADDNFFASNTPAVSVKKDIERVFGANKQDTSIVLLEAKNQLVDVRDPIYSQEVGRILQQLNAKTITSYYTTHSEQFVSQDHRDTYAAVTLDGTKDEQYKTLTEFAKTVKSDEFTVSIGGMLVGQKQTQEQAKVDLEHAELVSLPILVLLLFWFFRSPVAAFIPLVMSGLTIAGALAVARFIHQFFPIDTYTLNVITILGVGLSIDYSLLAVNRFRDELLHTKSARRAAEKTMKTAGRTVFFSGLTVMICLLALLLFPIGFMQSVSVGGAAAVVVAVVISTVLLPPALALLGNTINRWSLKKHQTTSHGWKRLALATTTHPFWALGCGLVVIAAFVWPVREFATRTFDWHVLPSNQSAYAVGKTMSEKFSVPTPTLTVFATYPSKPTLEQLCNLSERVTAVDGVKEVQTGYTLLPGVTSCAELPATLATIQRESPMTGRAIENNAAKYVKDNAVLVNVVSEYRSSDTKTRRLISRLQHLDSDGAMVAVTGEAARAQDTYEVYTQRSPYVVAVVVVAMLVILSFSLGSVVLPLQAVVINSVALFISLGILIMVFQFGWLSDWLHMNQTGGFELSIPILVFVIAFGLSMDYAVFLYSRMHEVHDATHDPQRAIVEGVAKTGPIITSAALLLFAVVAAFATSRIAIIQQIGVGLAIAVLVDAFFVRIIFVPAVMALCGKASWWAPAWLKKMTIKHDS